MQKRAVARVKAWWKQIGYWVAVALCRKSADPIFTPHNWLIKPASLAGEKVCILVSWSPGPQLSEHARFLGQSWSENGFRVILVIVSDNPTDLDHGQDFSFCSGVLVRANNGYDFGAWATAVRILPDLNRTRLLVLANDSVFGPLAGFATFLHRMINDPADVVGTIGSRQNRPHIQSFLLMFKPAALNHPAFNLFWNRVRNGDREWAIRNYELPLQQHFLASGISTRALYPAPDHLPDNTNPGLTIWRELIEKGFPFVKVQLLRDNPVHADLTDWQGFLSARGYDPSIVERYLKIRSH